MPDPATEQPANTPATPKKPTFKEALAQAKAEQASKPKLTWKTMTKKQKGLTLGAAAVLALIIIVIASTGGGSDTPYRVNVRNDGAYFGNFDIVVQPLGELDHRDRESFWVEARSTSPVKEFGSCIEGKENFVSVSAAFDFGERTGSGTITSCTFTVQMFSDGGVVIREA